MACLFVGHLAGNCDAAGDTWPVIHSSTASVFSGDPSSLGLARLRHAADLGWRSRLPAPLGRGATESAAAAVLALAALMKDGRDEANGALSPSRRSAKAGFRWACRWSKG